MKWFVGLGNPGDKYAKTRHNVGFMALDRLAERWGIVFKTSKCRAWIGEGRVAGQKVALIKPDTYMNLSGEAVRAFLDYYKADLANMIVIYDDMDTPFGQLRLRYKGGPGGHNGIRSIIQHIGTETFNRIRIGISRPAPGTDPADYVLSDFTKEEMNALPQLLDRCAEAAAFSLEHSFEKTMAKYNG